MKRTHIILTSIVLFTIVFTLIITYSIVNINNDSFDDYIDWCNEEVTTQEPMFTVGLHYIEFPDNYANGNVLSNRKAKIHKDAALLKGIWVYEMLSQDQLLSIIKDTTMSIVDVKFKIVSTIEKRDTPTIEGYETWKNR